MKQSRIAKLLLSVMLISAVFSAPRVFAQETVTVRIDGRAVFRVGGDGKTDAPTRAKQIERRLTTFLQNPLVISVAQIQEQNEDRVISVAGVPVVTVLQSDAQDNFTNADALAALWAQSIDTALERGRESRSSRSGQFFAEIQGSVETAWV